MAFRSQLPAFACLASILVSSSVWAEGKRLAVLEVEGKAATPEERMYLTDRIRAEALTYYPRSQGWTVMDRGSMAALIEANLEDCEGECAVDTFENISADFGVTGRLVRIGKTFRLSLSLYDVAHKALVRTKEAGGASVSALVAKLPSACARLFGQPAPVPVAATIPDPELMLDRSGMNELLVMQSGLGAWIALSLISTVTDDPMHQLAAVVVGAGAGVGIPLVALRDRPVATHQAQLLNLMSLAGLANGSYVTTALRLKAAPAQGVATAFALAGVGLGIYGWDWESLTPGELGAMHSGFLFGSATGWLVLSLLDVMEDPGGAALGMMLFMNGGLVTGYLLREHFDVGRRRMWMTDLGALGGSLVGAALGFVVVGEEGSPKVVIGAGLVGLWAGAVLVHALTPSLDAWKRRAKVASSSLMRVEEGEVVWGVPVPRVLVLPDPRTSSGVQVVGQVSLLEGRF